MTYSPDYMTSDVVPTEAIPNVRRSIADQYFYMTRLAFLPFLNPIRVPRGTVNCPSISSPGDEQTGMFFPGPVGTCIAWTLYGFIRMAIQNDGLYLYDLFGNYGKQSLPVLTTNQTWAWPNISGQIALNSLWGGLSTGTGNNYILSPPGGVPALVAGVEVRWQADRTPTGAATLDLGSGANPVQLGAAAVTAGEWAAGQGLECVWDGTAWQLISGGGGGGGPGDDYLAEVGLVF